MSDIQSLFMGFDMMLEARLGSRYRVIKYILSGSVSAAVTLGILFVLTSWFAVWYLLSSLIGYLAGLFVSFTLQKFWTFENKRTDVLLPQAIIYSTIVTVNLGLNMLGMYLLVDIIRVGYMLSQVIIIFVIAVESFFLYRALFNGSATNHVPAR